MKPARLARVVVADLRRNRSHFLLASIGIVVGIATFTFFLGLGSGISNVVLGRIFPVDMLEVVPRTVALDIGPLRMGMGRDSLNDESAAKLAAIPGVAAVFPKMKLTVPAVASGGKSIFGRDLGTELIGDGIDPVLVVDDIPPAYEFRDFDDPTDPRNTPPVACLKNEECGTNLYCGKKEGFEGKVCKHYIPAIASLHLSELYNGTLRRVHDLPQLNPEFALGLKFNVHIGASMIKASKKGTVISEKGMLVGFSDKAISLGATFPIGYVKRFNVAFGSPEAASEYHSIVVRLASADVAGDVAKGIEELGFDVADSGAEQAALLIAVFMLVFGLVSVIIVGIAAVNIMHTFFMLIYERQREIGIMRAVGASRRDIQQMILGEAAAVGFLAGAVGVILALLSSLAFDFVSARYLPDFPYKPDSYFEFGALLLFGALFFAVGFCVLGAYLPARRAARMEPARVLTAP